jgi:WD40 repeat protein
VRLWGTATGKLVRRLQGHDGPVLSVAFSPDGRHLVTGNANGTLFVLRPAAAK